ncbi:MAG TPA: patatin-like phospholipase family protein [Usitatibacter sp.]|nr:patatin-like phospholipase family protein [Usitatibacter sp.]
MARAFAVALAALLLAAGCEEAQVPPERLPRFEQPSGPPPKLALVLGSGGPRGFAHIGVLKVLEEHGVRPDLIVGSSVGSMVGAFYAAGMSAAQLESMAHEINLVEFFLELRVLRGLPASGEAVQSFVNSKLQGRTLEALPIRFAAAATRVSDRRLALFNRGDAGLAVRASGASPGEFEAVKIGDEYFIDADETSPLPVLAARALGARAVIAVDVSAYAETTPPGVPPEWIAKDERRARQIAHEGRAADVLLHPDIGYYAGHDEKYRRRVIAAAERFTREQMPQVRAALARAGIDLAAPQKSATARMPAGEASR